MPKIRAEGEIVMPVEVAIPLRAAISFAAGEWSATINVPAVAVPGGLPGEEGLKASEKAQLAPGAIGGDVESQSPADVKPELGVMLARVKLDKKSGELVRVTVCGCGELVALASWLPNARAGGLTMAPPMLRMGAGSGSVNPLPPLRAERSSLI